MFRNSPSIIMYATLAIIVGLYTIETRADWGDSDPSFGYGGYAVELITGYKPRGIAVQPDGRILVTGYRVSHEGKRFFLRRYLTDGQLDLSFGTGGAAFGPESNAVSTDYRGDNIVVQANGKIAVSGWANGYNAVWQFLSSGTKDKTFADNGLKVLTNYPATCSTEPRMNDGFPELNIQAGKLLLSLGKGTGNDCRVALVRLTSSGAFDSSFGTAGESLTNVSGGPRGFGTAVEADGKVIVTGGLFGDPGHKIFEKKLANGQSDSTFAAPPRFYAQQILRPGLLILATGNYAKRWEDLGPVFMVLETYLSTGVLDDSRSIHLQWPYPTCPDIFTNQSDGNVIAQLHRSLVRTNRFLSNLQINDCLPMASLTDLSRAVLQPDNKMLTAGVYNEYLMLVRTLPY